MKKKIIIGNWKMNPRSLKDAEKMFSSVAKNISGLKNTEVVMCPPFVYIEKLSKISKRISLGAQDAFWGDVGPFTGEVSGEMLYNLGSRYVILGHSERRALGETNEIINKKIRSALSSGLCPIVCVGESSRDHEHAHFDLVKNQISECLKGISRNSLEKVIIAYEPVWAISSTPDRKDATPEDSLEMAIFIRKTLADMVGPAILKNMRVVYGGSVNEKDAEGFLLHGGVDGLLPGKASLTPEKFIQIIKIAEKIK